MFATGLVFGLALMISGVANSFNVEVTNTVGALGARLLVRTNRESRTLYRCCTISRWFGRANSADHGRDGGRIRSSSAGRSPTGPSRPPDSTRASVSSEQAVNLIGVVPGGVGSPRVTQGKPLLQQDSAVADKSLGVKVGQEIALNGIRFKVNGLVNGVTYFAGQPVVFVTLHSG